MSNRVSPGKYSGTGVKINGEEWLTLKSATFWQLWSNCEANEPVVEYDEEVVQQLDMHDGPDWEP